MNEKIQPQSVLPEIPEEIRAARIGTCFNSITRKLMSKKIAIDPTRLQKGAVEFVHGKGTMKLKVNSTANATSKDTFYSVDTKGKFGFVSCSASIGMNAAITHQAATQSQQLNCYCSYVYTGQKLHLLDYGSEQLYNFMSEEFQKVYSAVLNSKTVAEYLANYLKFVDEFGHSCITELYLTSGSAFTMDVTYSSEAEASRSKYGGSVCVSTPWGNGGSVAAQFAKDVLATSSEASMCMTSDNIPEDTHTADWCTNMISTLMQQGLSVLSEKPQLIQPYTGEGPHAPEIPEGTPSKKEEPSANKIDITDELKKEIMKQDGFEGKTWEEYLAAQKEAYNKLVPGNVVREVQLMQRKQIATKAVPMETKYEKHLDACPAVAVTDDPWDLGGYVPFAYQITPWNKLFPQLNDVKLPTTFTSIYIAKIYMYYFTRLQFSSYLYFLADVGGVYCKNDSVSIDATIYKGACKDFLKEIQDTIGQNDKIDEKTYEDLVNDFETKVSQLKNFYSRAVYNTFFNKYDFFMDNSYGFIYIEGSNNYLTDSGMKNVPSPFSLLPMLKDAIRFYPIICSDGTTRLVDYGNAYGWDVMNDCEIHGEKIKDPNGLYYYEVYNMQAHVVVKNVKLYGVGFKDIPQESEDLYIRGLPMFSALPFDDVKEFAKPQS